MQFDTIKESMASMTELDADGEVSSDLVGFKATMTELLKVAEVKLGLRSDAERAELEMENFPAALALHMGDGLPRIKAAALLTRRR